MNRRNACSSNNPMSKKTLLALLPSKIDPDHVLVAATGEVLDVTDQPPKTINSNFRSKIWLPIEESSPRKLLLYNEDKWEITSFDPQTRQVCVNYTNSAGTQHFSFAIQ